jgi:Cd2+/Zn2+-exporting ATPase
LFSGGSAATTDAHAGHDHAGHDHDHDHDHSHEPAAASPANPAGEDRPA